MKKSNKKFQSGVQKLMVGICTVSLGTTILPVMNGISLNVVNAEEQSSVEVPQSTVKHTISGSITNSKVRFDSYSTALELTTTIAPDTEVKAGDKIVYEFNGIPPFGGGANFFNQDIIYNNEVIGKATVVSNTPGQVYVQQSRDVERQKETELTGAHYRVAVTFNKNAEKYQGISYSWGRSGGDGVVLANQPYTIEQYVKTSAGEIKNNVTIPKAPIVEVGQGMSLRGKFTFKEDGSYVSTSVASLSVTEPVSEGAIIKLTLSENAGIAFNTDELDQLNKVQDAKISLNITNQTEVNKNGAYIFTPTSKVKYELIAGDSNSLTFKIVSGSLQKGDSFPLYFGNNSVVITDPSKINRKSNGEAALTIPDSEVTKTLNDKPLTGANEFDVADEWAKARVDGIKVPKTNWVSDTGKVLSEPEKGKLGKKTFENYRFVETKTDEDGNVTHVYRLLKTHFVSEESVGGTQSTISQSEDGTKDEKNITGYRFIRTEQNENGDVTHIYHPVAKVPEDKTITRKIQYVDQKSREEIYPTDIQTVTLHKDDEYDIVTGEFLDQGNWGVKEFTSVISPTTNSNYEAPTKESVPSERIDLNSVDSNVVVEYPQGTEEAEETKTVTRTIKYVDKVTGEEIAPRSEISVTLTRKNTKNKATGVITEGTWSTQTIEEVTSPKVENYDAPDKAVVEALTVNGNTSDSEVIVNYTQGTEETEETKTVTRTIKYVDKVTGEEIAPRSEVSVTLTRKISKNKVTGVITEGTWSSQTIEEVTSPKVEGYSIVDNKQTTIPKLLVTSDSEDTEVSVPYHRVKSTFVDEDGKEVSPEELGRISEKHIEGYKQVSTKTLENGDVVNVYRKVINSNSEPKKELPNTGTNSEPKKELPNTGTNSEPKKELPNTGTHSEFLLYGIAASAVLLGLGLLLRKKITE